jgi:hypothetical protein
MVLALWATAMSTGTGLQHGITAVAALHEQLTGIRCAASADRVDGAQMLGHKPRAVLSLKVIEVLVEDGGKLHDHILLKSTWRVLIRPLMARMAFCFAMSDKWA